MQKVFQHGRYRGRGFTLLELMTVVAIVGILLVVAIPTYVTYVTRARVGDALRMLGALGTDVVVYYHDHGSFPASLADLGQNTGDSTRNIASIELAAGDGPTTVELVARMRPGLFFGIGADSNGVMLQSGPLTANSGSLHWRCKPAATDPINPAYLPPSCRD